jgi:hypothetical protein
VAPPASAISVCTATSTATRNPRHDLIADLSVALMPQTTGRIGWPGVRIFPIGGNPPSANLYITYPIQDDASVVRAF